MPGGLIQLVAFGAQNYYLNGNPSVSFFKKVYKTYTNFSMESMKVIFNKNQQNLLQRYLEMLILYKKSIFRLNYLILKNKFKKMLIMLL
jgi:hypothetical protein